MFGFGFSNSPFCVEYATWIATVAAAAVASLFLPFGIEIEVVVRSFRVK